MNVWLPVLSVSCVLALFACWLGYQLAHQNGRLMLRLEALEQRLGATGADPGEGSHAPRGLPIGADAPTFELLDLSGRHRPLSERRGRPALLIFFNPRCGFCA